MYAVRSQLQDRGRASLAACLILAFAMAVPPALLSQTNTGRLIGTVFDTTGAVVPDAIVTVTDSKTQRVRSLVSGDSGSFVVPLLDTGTYTVSVNKPGFNTFTTTGVVIQLGREHVMRVTLQVGGADTVVQVIGATEVVQATSGDISITINPKQVLDLPMVSRDPISLILSLPGTSSNSAQMTSINGQRTAWTNITRDGMNIQDAFIRSNATDFAPGRPSVDDTEEITLTTQNSGAESGYGGAQMRLITPRGGSEYHGALFEYNRNAALSANSFFNNRSGTPRPERNRNQFGGKASGPVPGLRDKLFFFAYYEGIRDEVTSYYTRTLLLPEARNGIFTYEDANRTKRTVNLLSLVPGVNAIDPIFKARFLDKMPTTGNRSDLGDRLNTTGTGLNQPSDASRNTYTARADYEITQRQNLNVVFSRNNEVNQRPDVNNTESFDVLHPVDQSSTNTQIVAAHRWTPAPTFFNEIRGGTFYSDVPFNRLGSTPDFFITPPNQSGTTTAYFSNTDVTFLDQGRNVHTYNFQDNAEKLLGRHSLRFGSQVQLFQVDPYNYAGIVPSFTLGTNPNTPILSTAMFPGGISSTQFNNANALFASLAGIVTSGTQSFNVKDKQSGFSAVPRLEDYRYSDYSFYVNDQWRVTPRFALNFGIRWQVLTPPSLLNGLGLEPVIPSGTDPIQAVLDPNGRYDYIGKNGGGNRITKIDWNNVSPVVSFAYTPKSDAPFLRALLGGKDRDTVLRGGFRTSYVNDSMLTAMRNAMSGNVGLSTTAVSAINPATGTSQLNARLASLPTIAPPQLIVPRTFAQNNSAAFSNFGTVFAVDPALQVARIAEYNFGIQRALGWGAVLEVRYAGSMSDSLLRVVDYNQIDIRDNGFAADFDRARRNLIANGNPAVGETLSVFPNLGAGGLLNNATVRSYIQNGIPADLALVYIQNQLAGAVKFLPNANTGVADVLSNSAKYRYNSLQVDLRRSLSSGFLFNANYTLQKTLTDAIGTSQQLVDTILDLRQPQLEYMRADYDTAQVFNFSGIYDLPLGRGRRFAAGAGKGLNYLVGGWRIATLLRFTSGTPITLVDPRGTLNRAGRSARQTPNTTLTLDQIKALTGRYENASGIYFIDPKVVNPATGRAAEGYGSTPFAGQVFTNVPPGQTGYIGRAMFDGPNYYNIDLSVLKEFALTEGMNLQVRGEAFNFLNHANLYMSQLQNINSTTFGKLTSSWGARVMQLAIRFTF